jgi:molybdopterin converting factor small subunit
VVIKIHIPPLLQPVASDRETVEVKGTTLGECIGDLKGQFPGFREWLDENNPIAWITMNKNIVDVGELDQKVSPSDELCIVLLLAGG